MQCWAMCCKRTQGRLGLPLAFIAVLWTSVSLGAGCPAGYSSQDGSAVTWAAGYEGAFGAEDLEDCADHCTSNAGCRAFEYSANFPGLECKLSAESSPAQTQSEDYIFCSRTGSPVLFGTPSTPGSSLGLSGELYWLAGGCPSIAGRLAQAEEAAGGIQCCAVDGSSCVREASPGVCLDTGTPVQHSVAAAACEGAGLRLCRREELEMGHLGCCGSGCSLDSSLVWTSSGGSFLDKDLGEVFVHVHHGPVKRTVVWVSANDTRARIGASYALLRAGTSFEVDLPGGATLAASGPVLPSWGCNGQNCPWVSSRLAGRSFASYVQRNDPQTLWLTAYNHTAVAVIFETSLGSRRLLSSLTLHRGLVVEFSHSWAGKLIEVEATHELLVAISGQGSTDYMALPPASRVLLGPTLQAARAVAFGGGTASVLRTCVSNGSQVQRDLISTNDWTMPVSTSIWGDICRWEVMGGRLIGGSGLSATDVLPLQPQVAMSWAAWLPENMSFSLLAESPPTCKDSTGAAVVGFQGTEDLLVTSRGVGQVGDVLSCDVPLLVTGLQDGDPTVPLGTGPSCRPGSYGPGGYGQQCHQCPSGRRSQFSGQTACDECPAGRFLGDQRSLTRSEIASAQCYRVAGTSGNVVVVAGQRWEFTEIPEDSVNPAAFICEIHLERAFFAVQASYRVIARHPASSAGQDPDDNTGMAAWGLQPSLHKGYFSFGAPGFVLDPGGWRVVPPGGEATFHFARGELEVPEATVRFGFAQSSAQENFAIEDVAVTVWPVRVQCDDCPSGGYREAGTPGSSCTNCGPGRYGPGVAAGDPSSCLVCAQGNSSDAGASECEPCTPGRSAVFSNGVWLCAFCAAGRHSNTSGALDCDACEPGRFGGDQGMSACQVCQPGTLSRQSGATACEGCSPGRAWGPEAGPSGSHSCMDCPSGRFSNSSGALACEMCPAGTFSAAPSASACTSCPPGDYADTVGATGCRTCAAGNYSSLPGSSVCSMCSPGSASSSPGASAAEACLSCAQGRTAETAGATECRECTEGRYAAVEANSPAEICVACPNGRFSNQVGAWSPNVCRPCPAGTGGTHPQGGARSEVECQSCAVGRYSEVESSTQCSACPAGRYGTSEGMDSSIYCRWCPAGTYSEEEGAASMDVCRPCPPGTSSPSGRATCQACAPGSYSSLGGVACTDCPAGRASWEFGSSECPDCPAGHYADAGSTTCRPCPAGFYSDPSSNQALTIGCASCPRGTFSPAGAAACGACEAGTHGPTSGLSVCQRCLDADGSPTPTPAGAVACCPSHDSSTWRISPSARLPTLPGTREVTLHLLPSCAAGIRSSTPLAEVTGRANASAAVATVHEGRVLACQDFDCGARDCFLSLPSGRTVFKAGERLEVGAAVRAWTNGSVEGLEQCPQAAVIKVTGFGCQADTLLYFFGCLTGFIVLTFLVGLLLEVLMLSRMSILCECSIEVHLPPGAAERGLPTSSMLWQSVREGLALRKHELPRDLFSSWLSQNFSPGTAANMGHTVHVEYAVKATRRTREAVRRRLLQTAWLPPANLKSWRGARAEQQLPKLVKAWERPPGADLMELLERAAGCGRREVGRESELHAAVAQDLLSWLSRPSARVLLALQFTCNFAVAGFLPALAATRMESCQTGYPREVHLAWLGYLVVSFVGSILLLRLAGGRRAWEFMRRFKLRLALRGAAAAAMLTDMYQDATFPVISKACGFDLWFVSAWLLGLGIFCMQLCAQLLILLRCRILYSRARTPEERERLAVEAAFLALRGSDNLVLVYALRPAVEERLGGASSWAMKTSEARIAFFRFICEDVEQSALQFVFLYFYDQASAQDRIWVSVSVATALLLSLTIVVQCLPEVRDWVWYRLLASLPGSRRLPVLRGFWLLLFIALYRAISAFPWVQACSPVGDPCDEDEVGTRWRSLSSLCLLGLSCCHDGQWTLLGVHAQMEVLWEVCMNSMVCIVGLVSVSLLAAAVWFTQGRWQAHQRLAVLRHEKYDPERRLHASLGESIRPKRDEDEDTWLPTARELCELIRTSGREAEATPLLALVESIDRSAFKLSRGRPRMGRQWQRDAAQLVKYLDQCRLAPSLPRLGRPTEKAADRFCSAVVRVQQVANARRSVAKTLSSLSFLRAGLLEKADRISQATMGAAPLRLLHWETLERLGELPRFGAPGAGAEEVHKMLSRLAARSDKAPASNSGCCAHREPLRQAESTLVPFFFSHRWLRVQGPRSQHHPDSFDGVKTRQLVAFARWFVGLAASSGLSCEVAFWIDYCCCDQDVPDRMEVAAAALPLYIAACQEVITWQTPDFDRRCWLMLERLLAYSFCRGGLRPYSINEESFLPDTAEEASGALPLGSAAGGASRWASSASFHSDMESPGRSSEPPGSARSSPETVTKWPPRDLSGARRVWQVLVDDFWEDLDDAAQASIAEAVRQGSKSAYYSFQAQAQLVDLKAFTQRSLATGAERPVREVARESSIPPLPPSGARASQSRSFGGSVPGSPGRRSEGPPSSRDRPCTRPAFSGDLDIEDMRVSTGPPSTPRHRSSTSSSLGKEDGDSWRLGSWTVTCFGETYSGSPPGRTSSEIKGGGACRVRRRRRKLPNPLDFEACRVTRPSDRRRVAQLVDIALAVPALEAFSDRQPVEFGLTEVVEQWLVGRRPLPSRWADGSNPPPLWIVPVRSWKADWRLVVQGREEHADTLKPMENADALVWLDLTPDRTTPPHAAPLPGQLAKLFEAVDTALRTDSEDLDATVRALVLGLKADLRAAIATGDEATVHAALARARDVQMPERQRAFEVIATQQLQAASRAGDLLSMRQALGAASAMGCSYLQAYRSLEARERGLRHAKLAVQLGEQLRSAVRDADHQLLVAVYNVAVEHRLEGIREEASTAGVDLVSKLLSLRDGEALARLHTTAKESGWIELATLAEGGAEEVALADAAARNDLTEIKAIEQRARLRGHTSLAVKATTLVQQAATRVRDSIGLPPEWDVVHVLGETDVSRLLRKTEEMEVALVARMQQLVNATFRGWGSERRPRTRDRPLDPIANWLEVRSVVYVQNAESYLNYQARRLVVAAELPPGTPTGASWDVKTARVPLTSVGRHRGNPVNPGINEHYLWHGTSPEAAAGITDADFQLKRAGTAHGMLFGPGIYLSESCMKADEYTKPDARGLLPFVLCRVILGNINYCDAAEPRKLGRSMEASCRPGGGFHSVLGDREKVRGTFREFVVYDSHQVYPEYIVWYVRR